MINGFKWKKEHEITENKKWAKYDKMSVSKVKSSNLSKTSCIRE